MSSKVSAAGVCVLHISHSGCCPVLFWPSQIKLSIVNVVITNSFVGLGLQLVQEHPLLSVVQNNSAIYKRGKNSSLQRNCSHCSLDVSDPGKTNDLLSIRQDVGYWCHLSFPQSNPEENPFLTEIEPCFSVWYNLKPAENSRGSFFFFSLLLTTSISLQIRWR